VNVYHLVSEHAYDASVAGSTGVPGTNLEPPARRRGAAPVGLAQHGTAPRRTRAQRSRETDDRILTAALQSFGTRGYEATSLDQLAAELGVTKQTILYHHPSKADLLDAVIDRACADLVATFEQALAAAGGGWERVEAVVRSVFRLALRRPELLGLLREVSRLGPPAAPRVAANLDPLVQRAKRFLVEEMDAGNVRRSDAGLLLVSTYSTVLGVATEVEVLRAVGIEPSLRSAARRRRELLAFLHSALVP
jgi:AcrR family transcriptional regulator